MHQNTKAKFLFSRVKNSVISHVFSVFAGLILVTIVFFPAFSNKDEVFESDIVDVDSVVDSVGDEPDPSSPAYDIWYAPEHSFGIRSMKSVNKTYYKKWLVNTFNWGLRASYSGLPGTWQNANQLLDVNLNWTDTSAKVTLVIDTHDAPMSLYYQLYLSANKTILDYIELDSWYQWNLTIPANDTEDYSIFFNWSDIIPLVQSGKVEVGHGVRGDNVYFVVNTTSRVAVDKVFEIDPTFGYTYEISETYMAYLNYGYHRGAWAIPSTSGTADSITIKSGAIAESDTYECALYEYVDYSSSYAGALIDVTEQKIITTDDATEVIMFNFSEPKPSVVGETTYYIIIRCVGVGHGSNYIKRLVETSPGVHGIYDNNNGAGLEFTDPLTGEDKTTTLPYIYCSYTEGGANTPPVIACFTPDNESTGNNLTGYVSAFVNDTDDGDKVNVTFSSNVTGEWVTYQDYNNAEPGRFDYTFGDFNTGDSQYWWMVVADDGTDNTSSMFWYETATNYTAELKIINQDINGSYTCLISETIYDQTINGSYTSIISETIVDQTINGSYTVTPITDQLISKNINGSYTTLNVENTIDKTINGSYKIESMTENLLSKTINGSYVVEPITDTLISKTINGSYTTINIETTISKTINGSYTTTISENILDQTINGSYKTTQTTEQLISKTINGSYTTSINENIIDQTINGSYTTTNNAPTFTNEIPTNNSENIAITTGAMYIDINDSEGDTFNYSWACSDGSYNSASGNTNGTKILMRNTGDLDYNTVYTWWVNATDGSNWNNETFIFTTVEETETRIINQTINGSYVVTPITDQLISKTINGSYVVNPVNIKIIDKTINGSYTTTIISTNINTSINGSYVCRPTPTLENEHPSNGSIIYTTTCEWNITVNDTLAFNWTINCSNGQNSNGSLDTSRNITLNLTGLVEYNTYTVWVNVTNGNNSENASYIFTVMPIPSDGSSPGGGFSGGLMPPSGDGEADVEPVGDVSHDLLLYVGVLLIITFSFFIIILYKRRKKKRK